MTRRIHVLHVDDNAALRDLTAEFLERVAPDLTVHSVADPTTVTATLDDEPIDCVVSDHEMPARTGLELCREVRDAYPQLPFFLFTSRGGAELIRAAIDAGATDYVQKEPGVEQYTLLANRIANAVTRSRLGARIAELERAVDDRPAGSDATSAEDATAADDGMGAKGTGVDCDVEVELVGGADSEAVRETDPDAIGSLEY